MRILALTVALTVALGLAIGHPAFGDVAMLPLDADARLEIYGQPVASQIARALHAGGIEVVVVKAGMDVPRSARLVIRGKISAGRGTAVALSIEVRNPVDGTLLDQLDATAPSLTEIDKAAADLAARVLPAVRERLSTLDQPVPDKRVPPIAPVRPTAPRQVLVGIGAGGGGGDAEAFRTALASAVDRWTRAARREPRTVDASTLHPKLAPTTVTSARADGALAFEVLSFSIETHRRVDDGKPVQVPLARARVRVRVADPAHVMFDRVIATDTIVGEREMAIDALAARVAAEVLAILRPHMRRMVTAWP